MELLLVDPDPAVAEALATHAPEQGVRVQCRRLEDLPEPFDCLVAAGNSFGLMDGGVDLAIRDHYPGVEAAVQRAILDQHHGELNVGDAVVVPAPDGSPLIAYAPTMRVPEDIRGTDNVYRAMRAWLVAVHRDLEAPPQAVACPGLGTGYGRMDPAEAARQMLLAWRTWHSPPDVLDWQFATRRSREVRGVTA